MKFEQLGFLCRNDLNEGGANIGTPRPRLAAIITSMPGFGSLLGAELLAATNGDLTTFNTADRLAGIAGLAPVPRDSGRISGNLKRPRRYDRRLLRTSIWPPTTASRPAQNHERITTASELRANDIPKPCSAWPAGASTSCGPCSETTPATNPKQLEPLDKLIETHGDAVACQPLSVPAASAVNHG